MGCQNDVYIYLQAGYDTKSNFKQIITSLNSEFPSPGPVAILRLKCSGCSTIYQNWRRVVKIFSFPRVLALYVILNNQVWDLNSDRRFHFLRQQPLFRPHQDVCEDRCVLCMEACVCMPKSFYMCVRMRT